MGQAPRSRWGASRLAVAAVVLLLLGGIVRGKVLQKQEVAASARAAQARAEALAARAPGAAEAIRAVLDKQEADWNKGDLDAFLGGYWRSPEVVFQSGGDRHVGYDAMRDRYQKRYRAEGKAMGKVAFSKVEIQELAPDAAFARGGWKLDLPDGKTPGGLFTLILRKLPDGWKIVHDHTSVADDPAPKPPAPAP